MPDENKHSIDKIGWTERLCPPRFVVCGAPVMSTGPINFPPLTQQYYCAAKKIASQLALRFTVTVTGSFYANPSSDMTRPQIEKFDLQ